MTEVSHKRLVQAVMHYEFIHVDFFWPQTDKVHPGGEKERGRGGGRWVWRWRVNSGID